MKDTFARHCSRTVALALMLAIPGQAALGQPDSTAPSQKPQPQASSGGAAPAAAKVLEIPDVVVLDQDNRKLHFYRDLVQGKVVAVNFIFTTCTTICPPLTANFARIQKMMRARGETGLQLISVSVDPENDTPERLKSYAVMFHAQPGWAFVTGDRANLEKIWKAFNINLASKQDHPPIVAIGNEAQHVWVYASGLTTAEKLMGAINPVLGDKSVPPEKAQAVRDPESRLP